MAPATALDGDAPSAMASAKKTKWSLPLSAAVQAAATAAASSGGRVVCSGSQAAQTEALRPSKAAGIQARGLARPGQWSVQRNSRTRRWRSAIQRPSSRAGSSSGCRACQRIASIHWRDVPARYPIANHPTERGDFRKAESSSERVGPDDRTISRARMCWGIVADRCVVGRAFPANVREPSRSTPDVQLARRAIRFLPRRRSRWVAVVVAGAAVVVGEQWSHVGIGKSEERPRRAKCTACLPSRTAREQSD